MWLGCADIWKASTNNTAYTVEKKVIIVFQVIDGK